MTAIYACISFAFGIAAGSFLNVLTLRYNPERALFSKHIGGRSHCMHCGKKLSWYELVPLFSFIIQWGKCRSCGRALSVQYPIVELAGGLIAVIVPFFLNSFFGVTNDVFFLLTAPWWYYFIVGVWVLVFLMFLAMTVIDLKHFIIPNELNILLFFAGVALFAISFIDKGSMILPFRDSFVRQYVLMFSPFAIPAMNYLLGMCAGGFFFWFLNFVTKGRGIGFGDVKLAFAAGLVFGWPDIALAIMLSFILGGVWSMGLVILGLKHMKDRVPFAPFFVLGFVLTFFFGSAIIKGYFGVFGL